jgi:23S rRNA (cytosine1962-C5)-methyltransferase
MTLPRVVLQPRRARPFFGQHPWVFAGAIAEVVGSPDDGAEVDLYSHAGNFIGRGLYNSRSKIRVRLYSWSPNTSLDRAFFQDRLAAALHLRGPILGLDGPGRACRLVFSEADGLSGLTVDRYDRWLVVQFTSLGMANLRELWNELLVDMVRPEGIYLRTERGIGKLEGLELQDGQLWGSVPEEPVIIEENGLQFLVHLREGQKTGFYLDQRANRQAVALLAPGRCVLDAFCYSGGFGLYCARAGARQVLGVDISEPALALARANANLNGLQTVTFQKSDVFAHLAALTQSGQRFDMILLDPPKFARARHAVEEALRGYRRLQSLALRLLDRDGILVTCCCSGLITLEMLLELLSQLAATEQRTVQILECRGQAADHPVNVSCPESNYLKCILSRVR